MKKGVMFVVLLVLILPILSASIEDEMQKLTHYAEEYETGNIDYVQFLL